MIVGADQVSALARGASRKFEANQAPPDDGRGELGQVENGKFAEGNKLESARSQFSIMVPKLPLGK